MKPDSYGGKFEIDLCDKGASSEIRIDGFSLDQTGISAWLSSKNILTKSAILDGYWDLSPWQRSGAETYGTSFLIRYLENEEEEVKRIWMKAITSIPPEERLEDWARRRSFLETNAVLVSNWYWYGKGIILEDYYPFDFTHHARFEDLIMIARKLDQLGFSCVDFLRDVRADEAGNLFYADFGFDLGEYSFFPKTKAIDKLRETFPDQNGIIDDFLSRFDGRTRGID